MKDLISAFTDKKNSVRKQIDELTRLIDGEIAPSEDKIQALNNDLMDLRQSYDAIQDVVKKAVGEKKFPQEDKGIASYKKLYDDVSIFKQAEAVLAKFINVTSNNNNYLEAIKPAQSEAAKALQKIRRDESFLPDATKEGLFLQTMELSTDELAGEKGNEFFSKISTAFSPVVSLGLALKAYYVKQEESNIASNNLENASAALSQEQGSKLPENTELPKDGVAIPEKPASVSGKNDPEKTTEQAAGQDESARVQPVQYVVKIGKAKASDITNIGVDGVYVLMHFINVFGILSAEQFVKIDSCFNRHEDDEDPNPGKILPLSKDLCKKGLLASFDVFNNGILYYAVTEYGDKCLNKEQVKSRIENLDVPFRKGFADWYYDNKKGATFGQLKTMAQANDALVKYFLTEKTIQKTSLKTRFYVGIRGRDPFGYCVSPFIDKKSQYSLYNITDAWSESNDENILVVADRLLGNVIKKNKGKLLCYCDKKAYFFEDDEWVLWKPKKDNGVGAVEEPPEIGAPKNDEPSPLSGNKTENKGAAGEKENGESIGQGVPSGLASENENGGQADPKTEVNEKIGPAESDQHKETGDATDGKGAGDKNGKPRQNKNKAEPSPEDMARQLLEELLGKEITGENGEDSKIQEIIKKLVKRGNYRRNKKTGEVHDDLIQAYMLARTSEKLPGCQKIYKQLAAALGLFDDKKVNNSGESLTTIFPEEEEKGNILMLSAYLYAMLFPAKARDYTLSGNVDNVFCRFGDIFPGYSWAKDLFHVLKDSSCWLKGGFSEPMLNALSSEEAREQKFLELKNRAKELLEVPKIKLKIPYLPQFLSNCFGVDSDFHLYLDAVYNNSIGDCEEIRVFLNEFCTLDEERSSYEVDADRVESYINKNYRKACEEGRSKHRATLNNLAKSYIEGEFSQRIELLAEWVGIAEDNQRDDINALRELKGKVLQMISKLLKKKELRIPDNAVLCRCLESIQQKLSGVPGTEKRDAYAELLRTGVFPLDDRGIPVLGYGFDDVMYFEPCRRMLQHIATPVRSLKEVLDDIYLSGSDVFDNLNQACHINRFLGYNSESANPDETQMLVGANKDFEECKEVLELAYAYNKISELQKENLLELARSYQEFFYDQKNFANWRSFLGALRRQIDDDSRKTYVKLKADIDSRKNQNKPAEVFMNLKTAENYLNANNFAVAEDYINRFDSGSLYPPEETDSVHSKAYFSDFLNRQEIIYNICTSLSNRGKGLHTFAWSKYIESNHSKDWRSRHIDSCKAFLSSWPRMGLQAEENIKTYLRNLGVDVKEVKREYWNNSKDNEYLFKAKVSPTNKNRRDYDHPIAKFGTQMDENLNIIYLEGNYTPASITSLLAGLNLKSLSILIIDSPISLMNRNKISELSHEKNAGQPACLVIDRVLMLYLCLIEESQRIPAMLQCTLPYTVYQPFTIGSGPVADEMFFGRKQELDKILDPDGTNFVYGGRQLGKTALLQRAESFYNNKVEMIYAIYLNASDCESEELLVKQIIETFNRKARNFLKTCRSLGDLCNQLRKLYAEKKIKKLLLLIDEADRFLKSISSDNYRRLQPLVALMRDGDIAGRFKFVLAGLHNVYRAQHALANNSPFGQLSTPLCIRPLPPWEAKSLLLRPLKYVGFELSGNYHMETILTNSNYYPGILQFFGYTLIQTLQMQYNDFYASTKNNPPYKLEDKQLGAIMNSQDLNRAIQMKIRLTLELDERYFMLARCITLLYHYEEDKARKGYSKEEIIEMAKLYDVHCLESLHGQELEALLEEMADMGILSSPDKSHYRLRRREAFIDVIGSDLDKLEKDIRDNNHAYEGGNNDEQ